MWKNQFWNTVGDGEIDRQAELIDLTWNCKVKKKILIA